MYINGSPAESGPNPRSISACLKAIDKSGTAISSQEMNGRTLLYFDREEETAHARVHPPQEIAGLYLTAESSGGLLQMVADFWKIDIDADTALLARRDRLAQTGKNTPIENAPRGVLAAFSSMYHMSAGPRGTGNRSTHSLSFRADERSTIQQLLPRIALYLGGDCRSTPTGWEIKPFSNESRLRSEIERLKTAAISDDKDRPLTTKDPTGETLIIIPPPKEEIQNALDNLAALGSASIPALVSFLSPERPGITQAVIRLLGAMDFPAARGALRSFAPKLQANRELAAPLLLAELARTMHSANDTATMEWLASVACDERAPNDFRWEARLALVDAGRIDLLAAKPTERNGLAPISFPIRNLPDGSKQANPPPNAINPLATCVDRSGMTWAVCLSPSLGNPTDLWLARGRGSRWEEFIFTGKSFPNSQMGYRGGYESLPAVNALSIAVDGGRVTLGPPRSRPGSMTNAEFQTALRKPGLTAIQRNNLIRRWQRENSMRQNVLRQKMEMKLSELRKDTDGDGLSDLVEVRLGTDPAKADTDGDGVPDGLDRNPVAGKSRSDSAKNRLLQDVFSAVFGGDTRPDPIFVVLDKPHWQEFMGSSARVICISPDEYLRKGTQISGLRALQFGGPAEPSSTILRLDGPCAFNEARTRAEVHFWRWKPQSRANPLWVYYGGDSAPIDYIALFSVHGWSWKLDGIKPWKINDVDTAMGEQMRRTYESMDR